MTQNNHNQTKSKVNLLTLLLSIAFVFISGAGEASASPAGTASATSLARSANARRAARAKPPKPSRSTTRPRPNVRTAPATFSQIQEADKAAFRPRARTRANDRRLFNQGQTQEVGGFDQVFAAFERHQTALNTRITFEDGREVVPGAVRAMSLDAVEAYDMAIDTLRQSQRSYRSAGFQPGVARLDRVLANLADLRSEVVKVGDTRVGRDQFASYPVLNAARILGARN